MEVLYGMVMIIGFLAMVILMRSVTTLLHELGHAIPALMYTEEEVEVLVGSYGDIRNSLKLDFGRLKIFFKFNPFDWQLGLCKHGKVEYVNQALWITLGGPIASSLVATLLIFWALNTNASQNVIAFIGIFAVSAGIDLIMNLWPTQRAITLYDGTVTYNDGTMIKKLLSESKYHPGYFTAKDLFDEKKYGESIEACQELLESGAINKEIYLLIMQNLRDQGLFKEAINVYEEINKRFELNYTDLFEVGLLHRKIGDYDTALKFLNQCFHLNYEDGHLLNELGFVNIQKANYEVAYKDLASAIRYAPRLAKAYTNFAFTNIKLGYHEQALKVLDEAIKLDPDDAYNFLYQGMAYEQMTEYHKALESYNKASSMSIDYHGMNYRINAVEMALDRVK